MASILSRPQCVKDSTVLHSDLQLGQNIYSIHNNFVLSIRRTEVPEQIEMQIDVKLIYSSVNVYKYISTITNFISMA